MTTGYPTPTVAWSGVGELPEFSRVESNGSLIIENVTRSDLGQYTCIANNDLGRKTHSVTLGTVYCLQSVPLHLESVLLSTEIVIQACVCVEVADTSDGSVVAQTTALLKCRFCSFPDVTISWGKGR